MNFLRKLFRKSEVVGRFVGRSKTRDIAITYRMGAGFMGEVNRAHPVSIEPGYPDATNPPTFFGCAVVVDGTSHNIRNLVAGDCTGDAIYGILVRPFPIQQQSTTNNGVVATTGGYIAPPTNQAVDVCRSGYIKGPVQGTPAKGGRVYVWAAANSGSHVQGGFETAASTGNTFQLDEKSYFNGTKDANGVVEIGFNI